jgi:hypothetical protein
LKEGKKCRKIVKNKESKKRKKEKKKMSKKKQSSSPTLGGDCGFSMVTPLWWKTVVGWNN